MSLRALAEADLAESGHNGELQLELDLGDWWLGVLRLADGRPVLCSARRAGDAFGIGFSEFQTFATISDSTGIAVAGSLPAGATGMAIEIDADPVSAVVSGGLWLAGIPHTDSSPRHLTAQAHDLEQSPVGAPIETTVFAPADLSPADPEPPPLQASQPPGERPKIDADVDALLADRLTPAEHELWWHAEHALLSGLTAREALDGGEKEAVLKAAAVEPGSSPRAPVLSPERAADILRALGD